MNIFLLTIDKTEVKNKEAGNGPSKIEKKKESLHCLQSAQIGIFLKA